LFHLGGGETGGRFTLFTLLTPPGGGPPPHYHSHEEEWFLPLEGQVEFFLNGAWRPVSVGSVVYLPRGAVHAFRNVGQSPLKMLGQGAPAGFETFFSRCAEEFARPGAPDMPRILEISAEHGIFFVNA
jgi:quercetin dioxygenase-like cupin family protein